jgi:hypothetical protein
MHVLKAAEDTIGLMAQRVAAGDRPHTMPATSSTGTIHLYEMLDQMHRSNRSEPPMSYGKANRWLGWMQCAVVAHGLASLDEMKDINRRHAGEEWADCDMGSAA